MEITEQLTVPDFIPFFAHYLAFEAAQKGKFTTRKKKETSSSFINLAFCVATAEAE